jgi:exodeoxyribonuclease VII large subunit
MEEELTLPWPEENRKESPSADHETQENILSVGEVNRLARHSLERLSVSVQGEVSGLNTRYSYFVYFDLRDRDAALPAILTQRQFKELDFEMEEGAVVVVRGTLTLYERQGKYQIKVREVSPFGEGDIRRRIEALKKKLQAEGIFDDARKKPIPRYPARIGVVTSPRGAAIRDVTVTASRRFPPARLFVRGVQVQGEGSVEQICDALRLFDERWSVDVVILARGGGSLQDLEPFNSERVARTMAGMRTPVISGVGHEPDVTVCDLVADRRASTPTGAAQAAVPDSEEVRAYLGKMAASVFRNVAGELKTFAGRVLGVRGRPLFRDADYSLGRFMQRFERAADALYASPGRGMARRANRLAVICCRPVYRRPREMLLERSARLQTGRVGLVRAIRSVLERKRGALATLEARNGALSPEGVLERGYSITFDESNGRVVRSSQEVDEGSALKIRLSRGALDARVTGKEDDGGE